MLPFKLLSDEPDKQYLADGMMDDIVLHLSKIKDLRIISRNSVEQYRKTNKTKSAIGKELGVEGGLLHGKDIGMERCLLLGKELDKKLSSLLAK